MTRTEVEAAIVHVLGWKVAHALRHEGHVPLPERLQTAALKAFREDWQKDSHIERLQGALMMLARDGMFNFDPESVASRPA